MCPFSPVWHLGAILLQIMVMGKLNYLRRIDTGTVRNERTASLQASIMPTLNRKQSWE